MKIRQPPFAINKEGDISVSLQCEQDNDEYLYMFWYRHVGRGEMQLVTYSLNKDIWATEAPFKESKYTMSRPAVPNSALHIHHVAAGDSAVYYCASRHTVSQTHSVAKQQPKMGLKHTSAVLLTIPARNTPSAVFYLPFNI